MSRIAILGGGISGLAAAFELETHRRLGKNIDWHLFEASNRLGGTVSTTRLQTPDGEYILEDGPDGWVTEKPWARELAEELGLGPDIIPCKEADKKTYIYLNGQLVPLPARMRLMVPEDLATLDDSPLFTLAAKQAYADELARAPDLKASIPTHDESVATFVRRHFGEEILTKLAAPLLSGVFGGDVERLSVRAVMPAFVQMESQHGSLIAALQAKAITRGPQPPKPTFTSLRRGMASLVDAIAARLPPERVHLQQAAHEVGFEPDMGKWYIGFTAPEQRPFLTRLTKANPEADYLIVATSLDTARRLLFDVDPYGATYSRSRFSFLSLAPANASSATLAAFAWSPELAQTFAVPPGFGFLVLPTPTPHSAQPPLLACTFVDQKFPHRAPPGARILRAFFGSDSTEHFAHTSDAEIAAHALAQLRGILGPLPDPTLTTVARWPRSLPQYEVGHLDRIKQLDEVLSRVPGLHLLGNSYHGVGVPDLIRGARATARTLAESLQT